MTKEEFKHQSDELFFQIKSSLVQKLLEDVQPIFEQAAQKTDVAEALSILSQGLVATASTLSFEASCDYSEKLALLLFDQFSK